MKRDLVLHCVRIALINIGAGVGVVWAAHSAARLMGYPVC